MIVFTSIFFIELERQCANLNSESEGRTKCAGMSVCQYLYVL